MSDTNKKILEVAQRLCQTRGYNGFSYADIAAELNITKASIHHHFPTKEDLGTALILEYSGEFQKKLASLDLMYPDDAVAKLRGLVNGMHDLMRHEKRICLCGMLASDLETIGPRMQHELKSFFSCLEGWLSNLISSGAEAGQLEQPRSPAISAQSVVSALQGMVLNARTFNDPTRFEQMGEWLIDSLRPKNATDLTL